MLSNHKNSMEHNVDYAKEQWEKQADKRKYINIRFYCSNEIKVKCLEYLNGNIESELENGDIIITLFVPENEHYWYGVLLSFGNKIRILEPIELKQKICMTSKEILKLYDDV